MQCSTDIRDSIPYSAPTSRPRRHQLHGTHTEALRIGQGGEHVSLRRVHHVPQFTHTTQWSPSTSDDELFVGTVCAPSRRLAGCRAPAQQVMCTYQQVLPPPHNQEVSDHPHLLLLGGKLGLCSSPNCPRRRYQCTVYLHQQQAWHVPRPSLTLRQQARRRTTGRGGSMKMSACTAMVQFN